MNVLGFLRNWMLPIAMMLGVASYFIYVSIPCLAPYKPVVLSAVNYIQPLLIFSMLFLTFCRVNVHDMKFCKWHVWLLLIQAVSFSALSVVAANLSDGGSKEIIESAMICLICPTATAAAVVVRKLGGSAADVTTYTILINLTTAFLVPLCVPFVHPHPGLDFITSFLLIIGKVFPLLLMPFVAAILLKHLFPPLHKKLASFSDLSFYLWAVALALAIAVTTKAIVNSTLSFYIQLAIALVSLICCLLQFYLGRRIGGRFGDALTSGQALGQKNTVLAIWMGYTFFSPITSIAGGFYSVWHNLINSYQLYKKRKEDEICNHGN